MKRAICLPIFFLYLLPLLAQDSTRAREEGWPELNVFYNINDRWKLFAMYSATKIRTSDYTDGATGIYVDYFGGKSLREKFTPQPRDSSKGFYLWLRAGYYYSTTPRNSVNPVKEHSVATESNSRFYLPLHSLLTIKNRFDWRTVNSDFKVRYRPRITVEKDMQTQYMYFTPYFYGEYFVNFDDNNSNRLRLCMGLEIKVALYVNFESYFLYQFPNGTTVDRVSAVGIALKFYLSKMALKDIFQKKNKGDAQ